MKTDGGRQPDDADLDVRGASVHGLIESLRRRGCGGPGPTDLPDDLAAVARAITEREDLPARFTAAAMAVGMNVQTTAPGDWLDVVSKLVRGHGARSVAIPPGSDGFLDAKRLSELTQRLAADGITVHSDASDETLFSTDVGITGVAAGIAEHGSLVCESRFAAARGLSLIPPVHVAVVAAAQVLPDLCDYFDLLAGHAEIPAGISLITGPSKTADIEGILVRGVHGPRAVEVVLVHDG
jgi:L-lactate dehydrogenase complex protein LldG